MASPLQIIQNQDSISYLSQRDAAEIDEILMGPLGFSVDQLMVRPFFFFFFFKLLFAFCCIDQLLRSNLYSILEFQNLVC